MEVVTKFCSGSREGNTGLDPQERPDQHQDIRAGRPDTLQQARAQSCQHSVPFEGVSELNAA